MPGMSWPESLSVPDSALDSPKLAHSFREVQEVEPIVLSHPVELTAVAGKHFLLGREHSRDVHVLFGHEPNPGQGIHVEKWQYLFCSRPGRPDMWNRRHEGCVEEQFAGGAVVGMVVVGIVREDDIRLDIANNVDEQVAHVAAARVDLAVGYSRTDVFGADDIGRGFGLSIPGAGDRVSVPRAAAIAGRCRAERDRAARLGIEGHSSRT